ncbi:MAG: hypothetical protein KIT09_28290 [Bryobacteraceae bacterium]|nr:hypothetical protein [Bryobacteraceae bacterium]
MASLRQIEANRRNAQLSSGHVSIEGRMRSALNNIRHELYAKTVVLPTENEEDYDALLQSAVEEFQPETTTEFHLVKVIVDSQWRLERALKMESGRIDAKIREEHRAKLDPEIAADPELRRRFFLGLVISEDAKWYNVLDKLGRQEERLHRRIFRAIAELRACRKLREKTCKNASSNPIPFSDTA